MWEQNSFILSMDFNREGFNRYWIIGACCCFWWLIQDLMGFFLTFFFNRRLPSVFCYVGLPNIASYSSKPAKERVSWEGRCCIFHNTIRWVTYHHLYIFYWVEASNWSCSYSRGGDYTQMWLPGNREHGGSTECLVSSVRFPGFKSWLYHILVPWTLSILLISKPQFPQPNMQSLLTPSSQGY